MNVRETALAVIRSELSASARIDAASLTEDTVLMGSGGIIDSQMLLSLLLRLEEHAEDTLDKPFEWQTDAAFSSTRSPLRTIGSLASFFAERTGAHD